MRLSSSIFRLLMNVTIFLPLFWATHSYAEKTKKEVDNPKDHIPTAPAEYQALKNPFTTPADIERGGQLYQAKCSECHGEKGEGVDNAIAFNDSQWMKTRSDGQLFFILKNGAGPDEEMEAFGPESDAGMSEQKLWQILAFVRTLAK